MDLVGDHLRYFLAYPSIDSHSHKEILAKCHERKAHEGPENHKKYKRVKLEGEANSHEIQQNKILGSNFKHKVEKNVFT